MGAISFRDARDLELFKTYGPVLAKKIIKREREFGGDALEPEELARFVAENNH